MPNDLQALIERVEKATGPDRELDAFVGRHVDGLQFGWCGEDGWLCGDCNAHGPYCGKPLGLKDERRSYPIDWREDERLPNYTGSVDAALALVERVLPGAAYTINSFDVQRTPTTERRVHVHLSDYEGADHGALGDAPTAPLAIIAAALRAMHQEIGPRNRKSRAMQSQETE